MSGEKNVDLEFCWQHRNCEKDCVVRRTGTIFCWRLARVERLCHPDNCAACSYKQNWFAHQYDLQKFIAKHDRRKGERPVTRVLAIDDEPNFLSVVEDSVLDEGYNCLTAIDGEEGLFFAQETIPDIILTDIVMPRLNGFELCRILKTDVRTSEIPVIMVTVRGALKDIEHGMSLGASAYLVKPVRPLELLEKIRELLPAGGPRVRP
jgi:twitching motility two-component system response regulator PilH